MVAPYAPAVRNTPRSPLAIASMSAADREGVAGLAYRTGDAGDHPLARGAHRDEIMPRVIQRRPGEVVHRRVDDDIGWTTPGLTQITWVNSTPALPAMTRPGSNISSTSQPAVIRATIAP